MAVPIAGLLSGAAKIAGATRSRGSGAKLAGSIVKREPKKTEENLSQGSKNSNALAIRPKQSLVPYQNIESVPPTDGMTAGDKLITIHRKIIEIDNLLKGTLAADKNLIDQRNRQRELEEEKKREEKLEKKDDKEKPDKNKLKLPKMGIFGAIGNFITNVALGFILMRLVDHVPKLEGIVKAIGTAVEWASNFILALVDTLGSFLAAGLRAYQWAENYLQKNSGEEAVERFHGLTKQLTNLFNAFLIVGSVFAALGRNPMTGRGSGAKKKMLEKAARLKAQRKLAKGTSKEAIERYTKRFGADAAKKKFGSAGQAAANRLGLGKSQIIKGGLGRTTTRFVGKTLGPKAMKAIGPVIKKLGAGFSRVPVVGSLIVAVSSLLAGEPLGQAAFKGLGAALGGFAGSFIPIPVVGTLIGSTIGTFIGDVLYTLILEKDPKAAGEKFMKGLTDSVKMLFDFAGMAAQFVKEGFGRLIKNFPTMDIPDIKLGFGMFSVDLPWALGQAAKFLGVKEDSQYLEDGKLVKVPNLALLTPMGLPFLVPHIASSFLPDIFGKGGVMSSIFGANGTAWGGSGESIGGDTGGGGMGGGGGQPELRGTDEGGTNIPDGDGQTSASGTSNKGMITGPAGYDRIGAGAAYHVDTKFHKSLGMGGIISAMDKLADAYAAKGREIVFSGQGYARLKAYKSDLDAEEKRALMQSAIDAHSHSTFMRAEGFLPFDYYIPATGIRDLYHPSTEKAEILLPDFGGTTKVGALYGGYGKSANIFDSSGKHVAMTGHGDLAYAEGGETLATPHMAMIGEEGKEFVIDADSFEALKGKYPGFLEALNKAEGLKSIEVLENYAAYENTQTQVIIIEKESEEEPMEESGGSGMGQFMTSARQKMEDFTEFLVGQG
mgnify:CR=1 FL=1